MAKKTKVGAQSGVEGPVVDLSEAERLLAFMEEHGLEEFEYERAGVHIRLKKSSLHSVAPHHPIITPETAGSAPATMAPGGASTHAAPREHPREASQSDDIHTVKSPIVGTFYASPSPDAEPFVTVGAQVKPGQVLCIVEAMKLMNEIESDVAGEVTRIFVENGSPVEYGQALFGIRKRAG